MPGAALPLALALVLATDPIKENKENPNAPQREDKRNCQPPKERKLRSTSNAPVFPGLYSGVPAKTEQPHLHQEKINKAAYPQGNTIEVHRHCTGIAHAFLGLCLGVRAKTKHLPSLRSDCGVIEGRPNRAAQKPAHWPFANASAPVAYGEDSIKYLQGRDQVGGVIPHIWGIYMSMKWNVRSLRAS